MAVKLQAVTSVLSAIEAPPHLRPQCLEGDLPGPFHRWFDGGAVKFVTGWEEYHFADGTVAVLSGSLALRVDIRLPSGACVTVSEQPKGTLPFPLSAI